MLSYLSLDQWQSFVESQSNSMIFHDRRWLELLIAQYGCKPHIPAIRKDGNVVAAIPFLETKSLRGAIKLTSLPFTDYLRLLAADQLSLESLSSTLKDNSPASSASIVVRTDQPIRGLFHDSSLVRHELCTARPLHDIVKCFASPVWRNLRRTEKNALRFERSTNLAGMQKFYRLHLLTRRKLGVPIQPKAFFEQIFHKLIAQGLGFVGVVSKAGEPIAAAVFLTYKGRIIYKYAASHPLALSLRPNDLLVYSTIRLATEEQFQCFDFGISDRQHEGLCRFKRKWGASEIAVYHNYLNGSVQASADHTRASRLASLAIRYGPPVVCRALGEVFYKYSQ